MVELHREHRQTGAATKEFDHESRDHIGDRGDGRGARRRDVFRPDAADASHSRSVGNGGGRRSGVHVRERAAIAKRRCWSMRTAPPSRRCAAMAPASTPSIARTTRLTPACPSRATPWRWRSWRRTRSPGWQSCRTCCSSAAASSIKLGDEIVGAIGASGAPGAMLDDNCAPRRAGENPRPAEIDQLRALRSPVAVTKFECGRSPSPSARERSRIAVR